MNIVSLSSVEEPLVNCCSVYFRLQPHCVSGVPCRVGKARDWEDESRSSVFPIFDLVL